MVSIQRDGWTLTFCIEAPLRRVVAYDKRGVPVYEDNPKYMYRYCTELEKNALACCGIRTMSGMQWITLDVVKDNAAEIVRQLKETITPYYSSGGNINFVLNQQQIDDGKPILDEMAAQGFLTKQAFYNHNMRHDNFMFIWDFKTHVTGYVEHTLYK